MENLSLKEFAAALSGKEPVPGGGGASACTGSYGCALGMMACALTHGKKKYACYEQDIKRIEGELTSCRDTLLSCINEDAQGFLPLSKAYGLPKDTPKQKEKKDEKNPPCTGNHFPAFHASAVCNDSFGWKRQDAILIWLSDIEGCQWQYAACDTG